VIIAVIGLSRPAAAAAILVNSNTAFTVNWLNTSTNPDLSGQATFTISNYSSSSFDVAISNVKNTTAVSPLNARLTSFGFGLTPDATSFGNKVNGTVYKWGFANFPAFQQVDVCAFGGQNCAGGSNGGLFAGQSTSDIMSMTVFGNFANGVMFNPVAVKFQTAIGSYEFDGDPLVTPEPASLVLMGSGLIFAARKVRRLRRS
jgi:hypothetical protein